MSESIKKIALLGNPNAGKSSLFNQLTGLRQKVGNFPGVTVERKSGFIKLADKSEVEIIDLPGTYSLYPTSLDERIAVNALIDTNNKDFPDAIIYIIDVTHLERHLLLLTQIADVGFPLLVALSMNDIAARQNINCDELKLKEAFGIDFIKINGRTGDGVELLKSKMHALLSGKNTDKPKAFYHLNANEKNIAAAVSKSFTVKNEYHALLLAHHANRIKFLKF